MKIDTGLGHVGVRHERAAAFIEEVASRDGIEIEGVFTALTEEHEARRIDLDPAISLRSRVALVKTLRPGDSVSYHRAFTAARELPGSPPTRCLRPGEVEVIGGSRRRHPASP